MATWRQREIDKTGSDPVDVFRTGRKAYTVTALGGSCQICGYERCFRNLAFHHVISKEFEISGRSFQFSWEKLKPEILKCVLLCHNCHGEVHAGVISSEILFAAHQKCIERTQKIESLPTYKDLKFVPNGR